ncbi:MAG: 16S rRNA (cytosine(1402)-N(4))-methyltransferase RsmH [Lachnospiraceae bacterium]|nr:16S rRNA (cytosine(1402)-N(4))-methyltransferase RsmH [Lachnospiraceae bacterium]
MEFKHYSVMLTETIESLNVKPEGSYLDGTLGGAGHSSQIAKALTGKGMLYGVDQDAEAIKAAEERLKPFKEHVTIIKSNYRNAVEILKQRGVKGLDGILLDLGVSSYQLDNEERGFSYRFDTPLDMRMDREQTLTAREIINNYSKEALARIIRDYGEDRFAQNIAKHICEARAVKPIETTFELNEIIKASIPMKIQVTGGHPSKRTFQAIRIECNHELEVLRDSLKEMIEFLNPGGRIAVITFHSLEDRIVKDIFREEENPCTCPPNFPVCVCGKVPLGKVITRKPIVPSDKELSENSRSQSAKLRVFERN